MRLYIERNSISKFRGKLFEDENLKTTKIEEIGPESTRACAWGMQLCYHAPRACNMRVGIMENIKDAPQASKVCLGHMQRGIFASTLCHAPQAYEKAGVQSSFYLFFGFSPCC